MKILVDADALPAALERTLLRASERTATPVVFVSNRRGRRALTALVREEVVQGRFDAADDRIVELAEEGDIVITADIPLADRVLALGAHAIDHRGGAFTPDNVKEMLATRSLMEDLRSAGLATGGPPPYSAKDAQRFANQLDRQLTRAR